MVIRVVRIWEWVLMLVDENCMMEKERDRSWVGELEKNSEQVHLSSTLKIWEMVRE